MLKTITKITGDFVASVDRDYACKISQGSVEWPATCFLKKLVDSLPEGDRVLHALTPNYDMLFEYTCDFMDIPYANGFSGGVQRKMDWDAVERSFDNFEKIAKEGRKYGVALLIVSQRPSDVSTTILSQCNNVIALRLTNGDDQTTVRRLMPESLEGLMDTLPILDIGEALVVGDAVLLPSRIVTVHIPPGQW